MSITQEFDSEGRELWALEQEWRALSQVYVDLKMDILSWAIPRLIVKDGKLIETRYDPQAERLLADVDALMNMAWESFQVAHGISTIGISEERRS